MLGGLVERRVSHSPSTKKKQKTKGTCILPKRIQTADEGEPEMPSERDALGPWLTMQVGRWETEGAESGEPRIQTPWWINWGALFSEDSSCCRVGAVLTQKSDCARRRSGETISGPLKDKS